MQLRKQKQNIFWPSIAVKSVPMFHRGECNFHFQITAPDMKRWGVNHSVSDDMLPQIFSEILLSSARISVFAPKYDTKFLSVSHSFTSYKSSGFSSRRIIESQMKTAMFSAVDGVVRKCGTSMSMFLWSKGFMMHSFITSFRTVKFMTIPVFWSTGPRTDTSTE